MMNKYEEIANNIIFGTDNEIIDTCLTKYLTRVGKEMKTQCPAIESVCEMLLDWWHTFDKNTFLNLLNLYYKEYQKTYTIAKRDNNTDIIDFALWVMAICERVYCIC